MPQHNQFAAFDYGSGVGQQITDIIGVRNSPATAADRNAAFEFEFRCQFPGALDFVGKITHVLDGLVVNGLMNSGKAFTG